MDSYLRFWLNKQQAPDSSQSEPSAARLGDADRDLKKTVGGSLPRAIRELKGE
jgi:hypothetical protein